MTLTVKQGLVKNTDSTNVSVGGKVKVGGALHNSGLIKVGDGGELEVNNDLLNSGSLLISDPEKIKELLIQSVKSAGSVAELGTQILKTFFGVK